MAEKMVAEELAAREATEMEAMKKAIEESAGSGSSPVPGVGSKRVTMSSGSTPHSKWSRYAWVPRYVEWFSHFLFLSVCTLFD
jgi:hypothetical protein